MKLINIITDFSYIDGITNIYIYRNSVNQNISSIIKVIL